MMHIGLKVVAPTLGALAFGWLAWRSVKTGMPAGNAAMNPRRTERPFQFWSVVALFAAFAIWYAAAAMRAA
jgi:hypothetical protein